MLDVLEPDLPRSGGPAPVVPGLDRPDLVIGSRYVPGGRIEHWPQHRRMLSRGGNNDARWLTGLPGRDATSGYRAFRRQAFTGVR